jgi:beta-phosphoglucomutase-like phosphatase (HAD superfamily)
LFPERSRAEHDAMTEEKEARFRALAGSALQPLPGLRAFCDALKRRGVRRAAVTNAPRANVRIAGALPAASSSHWAFACAG